MIRVKGGVISLSYGAGGDSVNRARRDQRMFCATRYFCRTNGGGRVIRMFCPAWIRFLPRPPVGGGCLRFEKDVSASISPPSAHTPYQREGGIPTWRERGMFRIYRQSSNEVSVSSLVSYILKGAGGSCSESWRQVGRRNKVGTGPLKCHDWPDR